METLCNIDTSYSLVYKQITGVHMIILKVVKNNDLAVRLDFYSVSQRHNLKKNY